MISTGQGRLPRRGTTEERLTGGEGAKKLFGAPPPPALRGVGGIGGAWGECSVLFSISSVPSFLPFSTKPEVE